jgi:hypothetical protein
MSFSLQMAARNKTSMCHLHREVMSKRNVMSIHNNQVMRANVSDSMSLEEIGCRIRKDGPNWKGKTTKGM